MLSQLINTAKQDTVHLDAIRLDGGTQPRAGINDDYVDELVETLQTGTSLPPVDVIYDGETYWLYDGFHRVAAHRKADYRTIPANIHQGTQADAQWRSYAANQTHGLRRNNEDKQRAIKAALRHPNGAQMPDREIARHLGVDHKTVGNWREKLESSGEIPQTTERTVTRDGVQYTQNTTNIGTTQRPRRHIYERELERIVVAWAAEHYPGDWPENPSHTNGTYWQQLTAYLRAAITASTWHESDLKIIIKRLHAQRRAAPSTISNQQSPINNLPPKEETADPSRTLDRFVRQDALDNAPDPAPRPSPLAPSPYKSLAQMDADGDLAAFTPRPAQPDTYASVHPLQTALRPLTATYTAADLRTTASYRGGSRWFEARRLLAAAEIHYRDRDLVQALNNLADELEQRDRALPSTASISSTPSTEPDALFDYQIDDTLAELVQQANADLDGQIQSVFPGSTKYWAEQVSQILQQTVTYQRMTLALERLMRALQEQRAARPGFVPSTPSPEPDDRINRARILINHYQELRNACEDVLQREREYEALVGTPSDLLTAHRGMHAIVDTLTEPIAKLQHLVETLIATQYESR